MRRRLHHAALGLLACATAACEGASPESGITARLRLTNAQFVPGALTGDRNATGPALIANLGVSRIYPGVLNLPLTGNVENGTSALIGLADDVGHWIVPTAIRDVQEKNAFQFSTRMAFSPDTPVGKQTLILRGVDADGQIGPSQEFALSVAAPLPAGALVFTLEWDTQVDLDLHVIVPNPAPDPDTGGPGKPIEIWSKSPVGLPPPVPGLPPTPDDIAAAGKLDFDSNANCSIDGRRQENVIFTKPAPAGEYIVRVDAFSMCGQASAQWQVFVNAPDGAIVNPATWQATEADTRDSHGLGAGRLAVQFTL